MASVWYFSSKKTRGVAHIPPKLGHGPSLVSGNAAVHISSICKASQVDASKLLTPVINSQISGWGKREAYWDKRESKTWIVSGAAQALRLGSAANSSGHCEAQPPVPHSPQGERRINKLKTTLRESLLSLWKHTFPFHWIEMEGGILFSLLKGETSTYF